MTKVLLQSLSLAGRQVYSQWRVYSSKVDVGRMMRSKDGEVILPFLKWLRALHSVVGPG